MCFYKGTRTGTEQYLFSLWLSSPIPFQCLLLWISCKFSPVPFPSCPFSSCVSPSICIKYQIMPSPLQAAQNAPLCGAPTLLPPKSSYLSSLNTFAIVSRFHTLLLAVCYSWDRCWRLRKCLHSVGVGWPDDGDGSRVVVIVSVVTLVMAVAMGIVASRKRLKEETAIFI